MPKHYLGAPHVVLHYVLQLWEAVAVHDVKVDKLVFCNAEFRSAFQLENLALALKLQIVVYFPKGLFKN